MSLSNEEIETAAKEGLLKWCFANGIDFSMVTKKGSFGFGDIVEFTFTHHGRSFSIQDSIETIFDKTKYSHENIFNYLHMIGRIK